MKFSPILELMDGKDSHVARFQEKIIDKFPDLDIKKGEEITLNTPQNSDNPTKLVTLSHNKIVLHYKKYSNFDDFLKTINLIFDALREYPVRKTKYIGTRYINQINLKNNENFDDLINKDLHILTSRFADKDVLRSMHSLEFKEEDYMIKFNFGEFNSNYPHPISKKEFVLDYICRYEEYSDIGDVSKIAKKMNELIYKWFKKSILKKLRDTMKTTRQSL